MRVAVFASYDKNGVVHEYVLSYLRYLKEISDKVIFIADNEAKKSEQDKIRGLVDYAQFKRHGEYDFGSYKRGYEFADKKGWLTKADELIFCNDSCFCIRSLKESFERMYSKKCDFWGMSASNEYQPHLQSFFLVFKKNVFSSSAFKNFIQSVQKKQNALEVIFKYEIPLKSFLNKNGFKDYACFEAKDKRNPTVYHNVDLLKEGYPLLKKKIFTNLDNAQESRRKILRAIKSVSKVSYQMVCKYYKFLGYKYFPVFLPTDKDFLLNFLYQKKEKSSSKYTIKICKIPVFIYRKKIQKIGLFNYFYENLNNLFLYCRHKISKDDYKVSKRLLKEKRFKCSHALGVAYNVFDGEELLEASIKSIRSVASYVVVVYQKISNFKEKANPELEPLLLELRQKGLIDELYLYKPKFNKKDSHYNEKQKRDIGLRLVKRVGCHYFLSMDTDEFYHKDQISNALLYMIRNKIQSSAVSVIEYLKDPANQIINGYSFVPNNQKDYMFYCPFIMKIHYVKKQTHDGQNFPCLVDPTRGLNCTEKFYLFPKHIVAMHHMSTIRKNLKIKYKNSNLRKGVSDTRLIQFQNQVLSYEYDKNLVEISKFNDLYIQKVPNVFDINIGEIQ